MEAITAWSQCIRQDFVVFCTWHWRIRFWNNMAQTLWLTKTGTYPFGSESKSDFKQTGSRPKLSLRIWWVLHRCCFDRQPPIPSTGCNVAPLNLWDQWSWQGEVKVVKCRGKRLKNLKIYIFCTVFDTSGSLYVQHYQLGWDGIWLWTKQAAEMGSMHYRYRISQLLRWCWLRMGRFCLFLCGRRDLLFWFKSKYPMVSLLHGRRPTVGWASMARWGQERSIL
jgi:hypothetical protein